MKKIALLISLILAIGYSYANHLEYTTGNFNPIIYLWLVIFLILSRSLSIIKKIGLPLIVGEILAGIILGDLNLLGIHLFKNAEHDIIIKFLAELGAIILMFEIGLQSKLSDLRKNLKLGSKIALLGSIFTFTGGFFISKFLIPNSNTKLNMLIGVICAATATGISARSFKEMKILKTKEVKIVLVASIIDEALSIFCFGIISSMILTNLVDFVSLSTSIMQVVTFFIFALIFGQWITPPLTKWSTKIHAGINMKIGVLLTVCFFFSWLAYKMNLATVIGAFIAGLILDEVYFKSFSKAGFFNQLNKFSKRIPDRNLQQDLELIIVEQENKNLEELLKPLSHLFVPVFFIHIGMLLELDKIFQWRTFIVTLALVVISFIGRIIVGFTLRDKKLNKFIIGLGMTPIGEAGLIFAMFGKNIGLVDDTTLSAVVTALVITAIATPVFIKIAINRFGAQYGAN